MRVGWGTLKALGIIAVCLLAALPASHAQKLSNSNSADSVRANLADKARSLESRGRPDMAIQLWQQILLSTPNNSEALTGLARDYKLTGANDLANQTLDRLRRVNPNDPNISKIGNLSSTAAEIDQLRQAGELARQGRNDDAMRIYRQLYGDQPPNGDIALAYYQTLYGTASGKAAAVAGMRALVDSNPGDTRYAVQLGVMLTYDEHTRAEGIRILQAHPSDTAAQSALRQALIWNSANPASALGMRDYLKSHPQDTEISGQLKQNEAKLAQQNSGIARTTAERTAFAALNTHRLEDADARFTDLLKKDPTNGRVAAGMGFLRMQQKHFASAVNFLQQAEQNGYNVKTVSDALTNARFYLAMSEGDHNIVVGQYDLAAENYRAAIIINPQSADALNGLGGLDLRRKQYADAAKIYEQLVKVQPTSIGAWRGLFLAYANGNRSNDAMAVSARIPPAVRSALNKDPAYLQTLATIYEAQGHDADAQRVLALALQLPFPDNGSTLQADTKLQYAGILMQAHHYDQAVALYQQLLAADPSSLSAWTGLISARHELNQDTQALAEIKRMPPAVYESSLADANFLALLAAIYQQANQFDIAQGLIERAEKVDAAAGVKPTIALELQLAGIYLQRGNIDPAYSLYQQVIVAHPDSADAWKGLVASLAATNRNAEALQEIAQIPATTLKQLNSDIAFIQTEAGIYAATGDTRRALDCMTRVLSYYAKLKQSPPAAIDIQNAWLLYNTGDDRSLYPALMRLGGRTDLTVAERADVQNIWANWSVRRAADAMDNGNGQRAIDILSAAGQAFPGNLTVRKAVAGGYARVGRAKDALALYKTIPMQDASAGDFDGAVGAALAANDKALAETWLRQALDRFPRDPGVLTLAARFEQARGDNQRAADYYRAALAAMPAASPTDRLAHVLVYPDQDTTVHRATTAADLQRLLDPENAPFEKTTKLPPLPAYGPDPYNGGVPVVLPQPPPTQQTQPAGNFGPHSYNAPRRSAFVPAAFHPSHAFFSHTVADYDLAAAAPPHIHAALQNQNSTSTPNDARDADITLNPPHSLATDAWKGLVFSLMAANRNAEALAELQRVPADVRRLLETDIEWAQGLASLYFAVGDTPHASYYLGRVENFYLIHSAPAPAPLELQHAWLLYNTHSDAALYPVLQRLEGRDDLAADQRQQLASIWLNWAVRRANDDLAAGRPQHAIQILEAAARDYPSSPLIRSAIAGAYSRLGRPQDALAIYKTLPIDNAPDMQGAIGSAIASSDLAQAETWLRLALARFPNDPQTLGLAARFEQIRGNNERASTFWRASLAAMPAGKQFDTLPSGRALPGAYASSAEDTKQLLNPAVDSSALYSPAFTAPANDAEPTPEQQVPLPSYKSQSAPQPSASTLPYALAPVRMTAPSNAPLPLPNTIGAESASASVPVQNREQGIATSAPTASRASSIARPDLPGPFTGRVTLPSSDENVATTNEPIANDIAEQGPPVQQTSIVRPALETEPLTPPRTSAPPTDPQIASRPMNPPTTQTQSLNASDSGSQLTQGNPALIHSVPNAPISPLLTGPAPSSSSGNNPNQGSYNVAQYTPSAQEAATGAYSAPRQEAPVPATPTASPSTPAPNTDAIKKRNPAAKPATKSGEQSANSSPNTSDDQAAQPPAQTLGNAIITAPQESIAAPGESASATPAPQQTETPSQAPAESTTGAGATDQELEQRNLPPLRGPWVRTQRQPNPLSPRDLAEQQLHAIESSYSGWLGGTALLNYRSGAPGFNQLAAIEAPFEVSAPMGFHARIAAVAKPVFLDSGQADGNATISVLTSTVSGTVLTAIPEPIGTLTATNTAPPAQQNAVGIGGELQLIFPQFAIAGGYTPANFLVANFTGRLAWKPGNGPFTVTAERDSVKDSQLSYAGLRDPAGDKLGNLGQIWGGVVANQGQLQFSRGDAQSGYYFSAGGQYLTGYNVRSNTRVDGTAGAYWHVYTAPEFGELTVGANFFAMHYANNQNAFTHGMGGYFSPQGYFLGNVPFSWTGHYETHWHYNLTGAVGVQAFQQNATPLWPLAADKALETGQGSPQLPNLTSVSANYDFHAQAAYQLGTHWFAGLYLAANNTRDYTFTSIGFFIRFTFRGQPSTATAPTGLFPASGLRPFTVP